MITRSTMRVTLQANFSNEDTNVKEWSDLFWKQVESDAQMQRLISLWLETTQEVAGKLQSNRASEREKSAVLQFLTKLNVVVIVKQLIKGWAPVLNTQVATVRADEKSSSVHELSEGVEQPAKDDVTAIGNLEGVSGPSGEQVGKDSLRKRRNTKGYSIDGMVNSNEKGEDEEEDGDDDDGDEDYVPVDDIDSDEDDTLEVDSAGNDEEAAAILEAIEESLKEIKSSSENSTDSEAKVIDTDDVQPLVDDGVGEGKENEASVSKGDVDVAKNDVKEITSQQDGLDKTKDPLVNGNIRYKCKLCLDVFDDALEVEQHMDATHNKCRKHVCALCGKRFSLPKYLKKHFESIHKEGRLKKQCDKCRKTLLSENFKDHVCEMKPIKTTRKCTNCSRVFSSLSQLTKHCKEQHKTAAKITRSCTMQLRKKSMATLLKRKAETTWCDRCEKRFASVEGCRSHIEIVHEKYKPHLCGVCGKGFNRPYRLRNHSKVHDPNRKLPPRVYKSGPLTVKYQCSKCMKVYKTQGPFEKHQCRESLFKFRCKLCGHKSRTEEIMKKHDNEFHKKLKNYMCALCDTGFVKKPDLNRHCRIYHDGVIEMKEKEASESEGVADITNNDVEDKGVTCTSESSQQGGLDRKEIQDPSSQAENETLWNSKIEHQCKICQDVFDDVSFLEQHMDATHNKYKKHVCALCGKRFSLSKYLKSHLKSHQEGRLKQCEKCRKRLLVENFKDHVCERNVPKNKKCTVCGAAFTSLLQLMKHSKEHDIEPVVPKITRTRSYALQLTKKALMMRRTLTTWCDLCKRDFVSRHGYRVHVSVVHVKYKPHMCGVCGKGFNLRDHLKKHSKVHDPNRKVVPRLPATGKRGPVTRYQCKKCMKSYKTQKPFERHQCREPALKFQCKLCGHRSKTEELLKKHDNEIHKKIKTHICDICEKGFTKRSDMNRHYKVQHSLSEISACDICGKVFRSKRYLKRHCVNIHGTMTGETAEVTKPCHQCEICGKILTNEATLKSHKIYHGPKQIKCDLCDAMFHTNGQLKTHREAFHFKLRKNLCQLCGKGFYAEGHLRTHIKEVHDKDRPNVCNICGKGFFRNKSLRRHLEAHERKDKLKAKPRPTFPCDQCDRVCTSKSMLVAHMVVHNPERNFKCDKCDATFKTKYYLNYHRRSVHLQIRPYECLECGKKFTNKAAMQNHIQGVHNNVRKQSHPCNLCSTVLRSKKEYDLHQDWHKGLHQFKCDICGKEFPATHSLQRHKKIHVKDPWGCKQCKERFRTMADRDRHKMKEHFGNMDWNKCKQCDIEFTTRGSFLRHMRNHKGTGRSCSFCGEKFPTVYAKEKHQKEQHRKKDQSVCAETFIPL